MNTTNNTLSKTAFYKNEKGMIFSIDALLSLCIILIATLLFVFTLNNYVTNSAKNTNSFYLEEKALMLADSLVKNYDENNTTLGACIYDADKKRVKTNELSKENISKAKETYFGEIYLKKITYNIQDKEIKILLDKNKTAAECVSAKRFVLVDGEKAILTVQLCKEE